MLARMFYPKRTEVEQLNFDEGRLTVKKDAVVNLRVKKKKSAGGDNYSTDGASGDTDTYPLVSLTSTFLLQSLCDGTVLF